MATYTTNLNLKKPAGSENVSIGDINNNMDTIDSAVGTLNDQIASYVKIQVVEVGATGSVSPNTNATVTKDITSLVPSGYKLVGVAPCYSGDDQFCWVTARISTTNTIQAQVRNVSSATDSGTVTMWCFFVKNDLT